MKTVSDGHEYGIVLTTLSLVDSDGIGQSQISQTTRTFPRRDATIRQQYTVNRVILVVVQYTERADITIGAVLISVVPGDDDTISVSEKVPLEVKFFCLRRRRIDCLLQRFIESLYRQLGAPIIRGQYLNAFSVSNPSKPSP